MSLSKKEAKLISEKVLIIIESAALIEQACASNIAREGYSHAAAQLLAFAGLLAYKEGPESLTSMAQELRKLSLSSEE